MTEISSRYDNCDNEATLFSAGEAIVIPDEEWRFLMVNIDSWQLENKNKDILFRTGKPDVLDNLYWRSCLVHQGKYNMIVLYPI